MSLHDDSETNCEVILVSYRTFKAVIWVRCTSLFYAFIICYLVSGIALSLEKNEIKINEAYKIMKKAAKSKERKNP